MFSQQSFLKMMNNLSSGKLSLKNRWSQIMVVFAWIFCLVSVEGVDTLKGNTENTVVNYTGVEGRTAILPCTFSNLGPHKVAWTDQWNTVLTLNEDRLIDDDRISVSRHHEDEWNLKFEQVKYGDQGLYTCQTNTTPTLYQSVMLSVVASLVAAAPCTGNKGENCTSDCNVSCIATACSNGTGECKNNTTEEQVTTNTEILLPSDTEDNEPLAPLLKCDHETGDCKNNTTETIISSTDVENASAAEIIGCEDGLYGANCSIACPANCEGTRCDHVTGDCISGCRIGYQGPQCTETCTTGYHGNECKRSCPTNCVSNECHHEHGYCLTGCKEDYWGSDCSLIGEFKDNPEPAQDHFYQHLSAESKSVLLYMLMSKYEETLERAQLEVNRGLQLRNKLRAIMGG